MPDPLVQRITGQRRLRLQHDLLRATEREERRHSLFIGERTQSLEARDLSGRPFLVGKLRVRRAPQGQRRIRGRQRGRGITGMQLLLDAGDEPGESLDVRYRVDRITRRPGDQNHGGRAGRPVRLQHPP